MTRRSRRKRTRRKRRRRTPCDVTRDTWNLDTRGIAKLLYMYSTTSGKTVQDVLHSPGCERLSWGIVLLDRLTFIHVRN